MKILPAVLLLSLLLCPLPAHAASISVIGSLAHDVRCLPGQVQEGSIIVQSGSDVAQEVVVYQRDYRFASDGSNVYGEPGSEERSNSSWISFFPSQFTLPPGESQKVSWTVTVPEEEDLRGTYWSMLMVEPAKPRVRPEARDEAVAITSVIRYGIQLSTTVGEDGEHALAFTSVQAVQKDGRTSVELHVENTGEAKLEPWMWVEVFDTEGASRGRFHGDRRRIYPNCSVRCDIGLPELPEGQYTALIVVDNGDSHVFGSQLLLEVE